MRWICPVNTYVHDTHQDDGDDDYVVGELLEACRTHDLPLLEYAGRHSIPTNLWAPSSIAGPSPLRSEALPCGLRGLTPSDAIKVHTDAILDLGHPRMQVDEVPGRYRKRLYQQAGDVAIYA